MGKVGRPKMRKGEGGREMYFCKLAPHKSDKQSSRKKKGKGVSTHTYVCMGEHAREEKGN